MMMKLYAIVKNELYMSQTSNSGFTPYFGLDCLYGDEQDVKETARRIGGEVLVFELDPDQAERL